MEGTRDAAPGLGRLVVLVLLLLVAPARAQGPQLVLQGGHSARVQAVAFSRDGRLLATASADGTAKLWDANARALLGEIPAGQGPLRAVVFSPDGRWVATAGSDGTIKLWDAFTLSPLRTEAVGDGPVYALAVSPDGQMLAAASWRPEEHVVGVFDLATGKGRSLAAPGGEPRALAFSPDSQLLAVGVAGQVDGQNEVELWDPRFGTCARVLRSRRRAVEALGFTPDGRQVLAATLDGSVEAWDGETTVWLGSLDVGTTLRALAVSPQGGTVAVGGEGGGVLLSVAARTLQGRLQAVPGGLAALAWSPDATLVAGGAGDGSVVLFSPFGTAVAAFPARDPWTWQPRFQADGSLLLCGHRVGTEAPAAAWWDASTLGLRTIVPAAAHAVFAGAKGRPTAVQAVAVSPRNRIVATASANGAVGLWNGTDGSLLRAWPAARPQIAMQALAFDGGGARLAAGSADGAVTVWDMQSGAAVRTLAAHSGPVQALAFASDGVTLASGSQDRTVRIWDVRSGRLLLRLDAGMAVNGVAFSPDGGLIAAAVGEPRHEGHAVVWSLRGGGTPRVLAGMTGEATNLAFSSNGTSVAVGSADRRVRLFDTRSGALLRTFEGHNGSVTGVSLSADSTLLAAGARDGTVRVWDARDGQLLLTWTSGSLLSGVERQWIAYDPQGYFLGSQNGASLVRWRNGQEVDSTERYAQIFFRPDLIERILRRGP